MNLNLYIGKKIGGNSRIATASVTLSLCVILTSIAVSEGFKREIGEKAVAFSGEIMLSVPGEDITSYEYSIDENLSFLPEIASLKGVRSINGVAYSPGMIKTDDALSGALFKGVTADYDLSFFSDYITDGKLPGLNTENPSDEILISRRLASAMEFTTGDRITSYFIDGNNVKARKFTVSGIYDIQLEDIDERLVICDRRHTQKLNGWSPSEVSCIEISLGGDGSAISNSRRERTVAEIDRIFLASDCEQDSSVTIQSVDRVYLTLFDWLGLLNMNVLIILILMTAVAGFNMISGLLIILFRNISAIGLFKSLGMRTSGVCRVFLWKAGVIILKGLALGNALAVPLLLLQKHFRILKLDAANYFVDHVPICLSVPMVLAVNLFSFLIMMLIMMIPCRFISGVSPDKTIKVS